MKKYLSFIFTIFLSVCVFAQLYNPPTVISATSVVGSIITASTTLNSPGTFNMTGGGTVSGSAVTFAGGLNFNNNTAFVSGTGVNLTAGTLSPTSVSTTTVFKIFNQFAYGTWTPSFVGATSSPSSITYGTQSGDFWKIMSYVCYTIDLTISAITGGGGTLLVSGTPYVVTAGTGRGGGTVTSKSSWVTNGPDILIGTQGTHSLTLGFDANTIMTANTVNNLGAGANIFGYGCYKTTE